ncbi:MAG: ParB/RepB/Spo0J family partition protein [Candidatus Pacebacteria bacterium]|nr:ParB/RepB/Spo0J family partition protein [Candidatus Paceibacterota bacterium]MDD5012782.1 ParB/RepB/Spo0J family partition protein [Candidatus Paceibacterota bacterium]MDD5752832.1 ParB/RepB/Spo0J family partition protein [Candidatus Paceibacterota bacterium]
MMGKGLESLIPKKDQSIGKSTEPAKEFVFWIEIDKIKANPYQPRKEFNEAELNSLSESIKKYGLLQPIIVTKIEKRTSSGGMMAEYQIIAGERRWRASKKAGLKQIPVIIKERSNQEKLEIALIENIQRKNLNVIDKAEAFERLRKEFALMDKEIAEIVGMSREAVSNAFRVLSLSDEIKDAIKAEKISEGHAKALLGVKDEKERKKLFLELLANNYSVREVERRARATNPNIVDRVIINKEFLEKKLGELFNYDKVKLEKKKDKIQLVVDFESEEDIKKWMKKIIHKD